MKKTFTFLVLSNTKQSSKRFSISQARLITLGIVAACFCIVGIAFTFDYVYLLYKDHQDQWLRKENTQLKTTISQLESKLTTLEKSFERVDLFARKLRVLTNVEDPDRELQLAIGQGGMEFNPELANERDPASVEPFSQLPTQASQYDVLGVRIDKSLSSAQMREQTVLELWQKLSDRIGLLGSTPSIMPVNGWVTSKFGYRNSPFSKAARMHHGMDIAAPFGAEVTAPADGIVSFVGYEGGYGKLVSIDHGYGVVTRYGHNASILVKLGQKVKRGEIIARVGNTGRSTGPHLHYEVRVNGLPVNPKKFILSQP